MLLVFCAVSTVISSWNLFIYTPGSGLCPRDTGIIALPHWLSLRINDTGRREHPPCTVTCRVTFCLMTFLARQGK